MLRLHLTGERGVGAATRMSDRALAMCPESPLARMPVCGTAQEGSGALCSYRAQKAPHSENNDEEMAFE